MSSPGCACSSTSKSARDADAGQEDGDVDSPRSSAAAKSSAATFDSSGTSRSAGATTGRPPYFAISVATSAARRLSSDRTRSRRKRCRHHRFTPRAPQPSGRTRHRRQLPPARRLLDAGRKVRTQAAAPPGRSTAPVSSRTFQACSGQTTAQPADDAVGQRSALVRAAVLDGQEPVAEVEDRQLARRRASPRVPRARGMLPVVVTRTQRGIAHELTSSSGRSGMNCDGCTGSRPSCHASRDRAFDLRSRSSSPARTSAGA